MSAPRSTPCAPASGLSRLAARILATTIGLSGVGLTDIEVRAQALPATGTDVRVGDLSAAFGGVYDRTPSSTYRALTFTPTLDTSETFDDGISLRNGRVGRDFITQITPGFLLTADTARITGNVFYAPSLQVYAMHGNQNQVVQNLNAAVTGTILPDTLFLDLRGFADQRSVTGQPTQVGTTNVGGANQVQDVSLSVSPYLRHTFGTIGTFNAAYVLSHTSESTDSSTYVASPYYQPLNSNVTTQQETVSFTTGDVFDRLQNTLSASASQSTGTGALAGSRRDNFGYSGQFAVNRLLALTAAVGHEDISYPSNGGLAGYRVDDITWSVGANITPNADSSVAISYGHSDGFDSLSLNGTLAPTARTRVFARYSESVGTNAQNLQNAVSNSTVNASGVTVDRVTGAPLLVSNNNLTPQSGVYRTTDASISASALYERDIFSVSLEHDVQSQVNGSGTGSSVGNSGGTNGSFGSVSWSHSLSDALNSSATVQYGLQHVSGQTGAGAVDQQTLTLSLSLSYIISQTLSANASYTRIDTSHAFPGTPSGRDIAILGLHKSF